MNRVYYGKVGGGKTHCVIFQEIIPALRAGRTVFTNIDSLDVHALRNYIGKDISLFTRTSIKWWQDSLKCAVEDDGQEGKAVLNPALVENALYVIDEAQFIWDARSFKDTSSGFLHLLEYNRHFGIDIVFITQNVKRCDVNIGRLANDSYQIKNLGFLHAFARNKYCVNRRQTPFDKDVIAQYTQSYQKAIFSLYRSGADANAGNKQKSRFSTFMIMPFVFLFIVGVVVLVKQGNPVNAVSQQLANKNKGGVKDVLPNSSVPNSSALARYKSSAVGSVESNPIAQEPNKKSIVKPSRYDLLDLQARCNFLGFVAAIERVIPVRSELYECPEAVIYVSNGKMERVMKKMPYTSSESLKIDSGQAGSASALSAVPALAEGGQGKAGVSSYRDLIYNGNKSNTSKISYEKQGVE